MLSIIQPYLKFRYLLYFFGLVAGWPCVFYLMGWLPHYTINYVLLFVLVSFFVLLGNKLQVPRPISFLILFQTVAWAVYSLIHGFDTSYFTRIMMLCITFMFMELQMRYRYEFIKTYNFWLVVQVVAGTIGVLLVFSGILEPLFRFREMDMRWGYYFGLFTTNTYIEGFFLRNAGFYDEPGALAFWGMYALLINKLFVKNTKVEILLIFGLISTFSMAYFIQLALYVWFFYKERQRKAFLLILTFILSLNIVASFNEDIEHAIFGRFEYDEETGTLEGDNRSQLMETCWEIFKTSPIIGQGARNLIDISQQQKKFVGANAFTTLASDGVFGQIIVWSPFFFLYSIRRKDKKYGWAFWILIVGFLQRPYDCSQLLYPLMSFTIILNAYLETNNDQEYD